MYASTTPVLASTTASVGAVSALAQTGVAAGWFLVAGVALLTVGVFLLRLIPRDEF